MYIGELTLLGSCPVNCLYHMEFDPQNMPKILTDEAREHLAIFEDCLKESDNTSKNRLQPPKDKKDKTEAMKDITEAKLVVKKNTRTDGFVSPTKFAKKQKVVKNDSVGATAPVKITNQYQALAGNSTLPDADITVVPVATPKIPPINLKFRKNYQPILKEISKKFPTSSAKLSGDYLKIFATSPDEHRNITSFLTEKGEQYFALEPIAKRPQKPKKGEPSQDRHKNSSQNIFSSAKVHENISYANALKSDHKMAPHPEQTSSKSNETPFADKSQAASGAENESFGFMDAILELKKFFTDYPSFLELGKQLKQAQGDERLDVFYRHLISIK
ncbi:hypothetical protein TNIN_213901 [Trichonephila inaurata madagascariensis]|uniref:Uncharacterized protein n=1 Tax=Trichonephila inaurata madagascariensis TaxID=2747483 RepID=A0A8X7CLW4_9ARAC|nr:hypothetical protein TNIN_213901 [Trichonephila inaurata madagascariensis]